jgi:hypothetical protein
MEHKASAGISLAHPAGAESTPSRRFGCSTGGHATRDDDHARGAAIESDERTRGTRRGTGQGECVAGTDRRTERRDGGGLRRGRPGGGGGTAAGAANSPCCSKTARIAAASASVTTNMLAGWEGRPWATSSRVSHTNRPSAPDPGIAGPRLPPTRIYCGCLSGWHAARPTTTIHAWWPMAGYERQSAATVSGKPVNVGHRSDGVRGPLAGRAVNAGAGARDPLTLSTLVKLLDRIGAGRVKQPEPRPGADRHCRRRCGDRQRDLSCDRQARARPADHANALLDLTVSNRWITEEGRDGVQDVVLTDFVKRVRQLEPVPNNRIRDVHE